MFVLLGIYGTFVLSHHFFLSQNPLRDCDKFGFGVDDGDDDDDDDDDA